MVAKFFGALFGSGAVPGSAAVSDAESRSTAGPAADELTVTGTALEELRRMALGRGSELPTVVVSQLLQVVDVLRALIGYIGRSGASTEQRVLLNAVVTDYLPSPLRAYLMLAAESRHEESAETSGAAGAARDALFDCEEPGQPGPHGGRHGTGGPRPVPTGQIRY